MTIVMVGLSEEARGILERAGASQAGTLDQAILAAYRLGHMEGPGAPGPDELTVLEAARELGVERGQVYHLIQRGRLQVRRWQHPTDRSHRRTFVTRASLIAVRDDPQRLKYRRRLGWPRTDPMPGNDLPARFPVNADDGKSGPTYGLASDLLRAYLPAADARGMDGG